MKHTRLFLIVIILAGLFTRPAMAESATDHIVISEIQTGSATSASQEFVELYNPTDQPVVLDDWQMQYRAAVSTSSWAGRTGSGMHGTIPAHGFFLIAATTYLPNADNTFSSGMAAGGGSLRLVDGEGNVIDLVGWGTAVEVEGDAAPTAEAGQSIERLPGATNFTGGNWVDTDNNNDDFGVSTSPQPQSSASPAELPGDIGTPTSPGTTTTPDPSEPTTQPDPASTPAPSSTPSPIIINELFVDPGSPLSDTKDEFIELYNPGSTNVSLSGYVLKTGTNFHDTYTIPATTITAGGYQVLYSVQTKLSLTNSSGAAELLDPSGTVISLSAEYDGSLTNLSFARFGEDWQWTTARTPGAANVYAAPPTAAETTAAKKATAAKANTAKKATTKKVAASKIKAPKAVKVKAATSKTLAAKAQPSGLAAKWLIIGLATLTIGYAIYEFRYDIQNYYNGVYRKYRAWRTPR